MKFFREKPLKVQIAFVLVFLALVCIIQTFLIQWRFASVNDAYKKTDYVRKAQITFQQIALLSNQFLQGQPHLASIILSHLDQQEHQLKLLAEGGRIDDTAIIINGLSKLPKITFDELYPYWSAYKESVLTLTSGDGLELSKEKARKRIEGQWLSTSQWYDRLVNDLDEELEEVRTSAIIWLFSLVLLDFVIIAYLYYFFNQKLFKPLKALETNTALHVHTYGFENNEIADVTHQVNDVIEQLKDASDFVQTIGEGNLSRNYTEFDAHYVKGKNKLADSLIEMQSKLRLLNEEEQRRTWANEGLAKFVDILRSTGDNITELSDKIIAALVQYTRSNQGALYLLHDEDESNYLELISLFAFDVKKYAHQHIKLGEGIIGQAFLEKETTYLTEVPHNYIRITSGLGEANPKTVLIVPLKIDTQVYGIVELASFNEFQPHEISFVEKLGEAIASTLATVKSAQRNRKLLDESKLAAEALQSQEEEMRQNMEELQATQEEIARKEKDYINKIAQLEQHVGSNVSSSELQSLKRELEDKEKNYQATINEMEEQLNTLRSKADSWSIAEEVEHALKVNLEALRITQEELNKGKSV